MTVLLPMGFDAAEDHDLMKSLNMLDAEFTPFSDEDLALVGDDLLAFGDSGSGGESSPFAVDDFLVPAAKLATSLPAAPAPVVAPMVPLAALHSKQSSSPHSSGALRPRAAPNLVSLEPSIQLPISTQSACGALTSSIGLLVRDSTLLRRSTDSWHPAGSDATSDSASDSAIHEPESSKPSATGGQRKDPRIGKRKPCPDLNSIEDMQERRKQRRLAKNRATAAVSRCGA